MSDDYISFGEVVNDYPQKIYYDWMHRDYRCLVMRGPVSLCAYIGVPPEHRYYGKDYNEVDLRCHYGLTFSSEGDGKIRPKGYWWFGWDYAHFGDVTFFDFKEGGYDGIEWTPDMVKFDVEEALEFIDIRWDHVMEERDE